VKDKTFCFCIPEAFVAISLTCIVFIVYCPGSLLQPVFCWSTCAYLISFLHTLQWRQPLSVLLLFFFVHFPIFSFTSCMAYFSVYYYSQRDLLGGGCAALKGKCAALNLYIMSQTGSS